jgi:hypothetical protein
METAKTYENYPVWIVLLSNMLSLAIYSLGFAILLNLGLLFSFLFLTYVFILEFRVVRYHCINCDYWGKTCGFGKGRISSILFKKGDPIKFCEKDFTWKDMIPDLLVLLIPLVIGIFFLIKQFNLVLLFELVLLIFFTTRGNAFIRGKLTCKYCKQRELGCLAEKLFNKK